MLSTAVCYMANDQRRRMRGKVFPVRGCHRPCPGARLPGPPGTWRPTVQWGCQGGGAVQQSWGQGQGRGFCGAADAAIVSGRIRQCQCQPEPGGTDQHLCWSEAWLSNCRRLVGVIRAVIAGLPPQAHCCGCGWGEHLARPPRGAGGRVVRQLHQILAGVVGCGEWVGPAIVACVIRQ